MNPRLSRGRILRAVTGLFLAIVSVQASQPQQNQDSYTAGGHLRKPSKHSALPVQGEFQEKQPEPRTQQEHRQKREERYGSFLREPITDPGPMVDGQPETTNLSFIDYVSIGNSVDPRGIPASVSTA